MARETEGTEIPQARPLTQGEFYLAMTERPDSQGLGLRPVYRSFFVGQERAYRRLYDAITQSPSGTLIALTAPFGAGKDALLDVVLADLIKEGKIKGEEAQRVHVDFDLGEGMSFEQTKRTFSWVNPPENPQSIKPKVLSVNEVAYGWNHSKARIQKQLAIAGTYLGKEVPVMVLLGDYALEDPEIVGAVGSPHEPVIIKLDPLTPDMLREALRQRVAYSLERDPKEIDVNSMLDPDFLTSLIPNTEYPVATMRSALGIVEAIGRKLKPTEEPARITKSLAAKYYAGKLYDDFWRASESKQQFMLWMMDHIKNHRFGRDLMKAMTIEEMMQECPLGLSPEEYQENIIKELARSNEGLQRVTATPALYLPRQHFFFRTSIRPVPLDPFSEDGAVQVNKMDERVYRSMYRSEFRNIEVWSPFIQRMEAIYGWDTDFGRDLVMDVIDSYDVRSKAEREEMERKLKGE